MKKSSNKPSQYFPVGIVLALLVLAGFSHIPEHFLRPAPEPLTKEEQAALTPEQALDRLKEGNQRFVSGKSFDRHWGQQRASTAEAQYPFAFVLSCIDSRTSTEVVFDQGMGDLFNARIAGNVLSSDILGSMEFACQVAGAKVIAVLGHTECGAILGACSGVKLGHLTGLLAKVEPCVKEARVDQPGVPGNNPALVAEVTKLNVRKVMAQIQRESPILQNLIASGNLRVVGGIHDLETGEVRFLAE